MQDCSRETSQEVSWGDDFRGSAQRMERKGQLGCFQRSLGYNALDEERRRTGGVRVVLRCGTWWVHGWRGGNSDLWGKVMGSDVDILIWRKPPPRVLVR